MCMCLSDFVPPVLTSESVFSREAMIQRAPIKLALNGILRRSELLGEFTAVDPFLQLILGCPQVAPILSKSCSNFLKSCSKVAFNFLV